MRHVPFILLFTALNLVGGCMSMAPPESGYAPLPPEAVSSASLGAGLVWYKVGCWQSSILSKDGGYWRTEFLPYKPAVARPVCEDSSTMYDGVPTSGMTYMVFGRRGWTFGGVYNSGGLVSPLALQPFGWKVCNAEGLWCRNY